METDALMAFLLLYLGINLVSAAAFAGDKRKARQNTRRTRESTLLVLAFLGPFGAFAAMRMFRHKTLKLKFLLIPLFLVLHSTILAFLLMTLRI